jgi:hypothetical protein
MAESYVFHGQCRRTKARGLANLILLEAYCYRFCSP